MLRFCSLASGSSGNATLIEATAGAGARPARLLVDCGLTLRQIEQRLLAM
ncbi:MAG: MBL fold metallo-hydrolase, partial [Burkholderiaceae bacterium]|nr:MBL fold metallo-hydrolase [Burkholderiaceae bacterium]